MATSRSSTLELDVLAYDRSVLLEHELVRCRLRFFDVV